MQEQFAEILYYVKATLRYKWVIIITAWLICMPAWWYILNMPDKYTSTARVQVDTRTMLRPLLSGLAIQSDIRGMVAIMKQLMFTRQNLEKIAELAGMSVEEKTEAQKLGVVNKLKGNIRIDGGRDDIFNISYDASDPLEAKHVVQAVLTVFSEQTQRTALDDADSAQRFLLTQIQEYEQRLRNAEKARENFKRANIGMLPGQGGDQVGQIQQLNATLEETKLSLKELHSRKAVLQEQLLEAQESAEDEWGLALDANKAEDPRLTSLIAQRDELLLKYTEKHPSVKVLTDTIRAIQRRKSKEAAETQEEGPAVPLSNPFVQSIKASLNEIDAQMASVNSRIEAYKDKIAKLNEEFNQRLNIETEMQNLNRDYETIKSNYHALLQRREQANLSEKVDNQGTSLRFKIADPPNKPLSPSAPNRGLLYSAALGGSLVLGIALAFLAVLIKPTFIAANQIRNMTGLPVLGSITVIRNRKQTKKMRLQLIQYFAACTLLLTAYAGMMVFKN
ncbi:MAG: Wzz/FepE/Etk N-terminal domain-containing protein [Methylomicrobium sp.]